MRKCKICGGILDYEDEGSNKPPSGLHMCISPGARDPFELLAEAKKEAEEIRHKLSRELTWKDVFDGYKMYRVDYDIIVKYLRSTQYRYLAFNGMVYSANDNKMERPICTEEDLNRNASILKDVNSNIFTLKVETSNVDPKKMYDAFINSEKIIEYMENMSLFGEMGGKDPLDKFMGRYATIDPKNLAINITGFQFINGEFYCTFILLKSHLSKIYNKIDFTETIEKDFYLLPRVLLAEGTIHPITIDLKYKSKSI